MTPGSDEIVTNPESAHELCFLQIHDAFTNIFADSGTSVLPFSDLKIAGDTFQGDLVSHQSMTSSSLSLVKHKC
jgi:hypothetical protein